MKKQKLKTRRDVKKVLTAINSTVVGFLIVLILIILFLTCIFTTDDSGNEKDDGAAEAIATVDTDESTALSTSYEEEKRITTEEQTESPEELADKELTALLNNMSVEEKVGQMFFIRADASYDKEMFDTYHPGGLILFGKDVGDKTSSEIWDYIENFQSNSKYPLFIGIDEEGGTVTRIGYNYALVDDAFQSPRQLYELGGYDAVTADSHKKSKLLKSLGINVNFAPVVDYSVDYGDFMYERAFGENINETCEFADKIVTAMKEEHMGCVLKHFPGYGNNGDTHTGMVTDLRDYDTFEEQDFLPFEAGIAAGADCVLVSHNIVLCMDDEFPASLSEKVHKILREDLKFDGVIITDDLAMSGAADYAEADAVAVQAVKAGNDMMIVSDYETQYAAVVEAVKNGEIDISRIDDSVMRILKWKYNLLLLEDLGTY